MILQTIKFIFYITLTGKTVTAIKMRNCRQNRKKNTTSTLYLMQKLKAHSNVDPGRVHNFVSTNDKNQPVPITRYILDNLPNSQHRPVVL